MEKKEWTPRDMVESAEGFHESLSLRSLPDSFWKQSMFTKPADRDVVCHASAWDMDMKGDVRIKMCIEVNAEDLATICHELGRLPGKTPCARYFLARILQFHRAMCEAAGHEGPLHECSVYGNNEAGERFGAMMEKGQSQPWQETLAELTGKPEMDASAIVDYNQPLMAWLNEKNEGRQCGWTASGASVQTSD